MNVIPIKLSEPFAPRALGYLGHWMIDEWSFKIYTITYHSNTQASSEYLTLVKRLWKKIPDVSKVSSYGIGFIILHNGWNANFISFNWFADENMIVTHSFVAPIDHPLDYRFNTLTGMNMCVWDCAVIWQERSAWVKCIMSDPQRPDVDGYMNSIATNMDELG
ncbi:hypothetical protein K1X84_09770 [bacterium]|nr:hypothetical protein [bacterium]